MQSNKKDFWGCPLGAGSGAVQSAKDFTVAIEAEQRRYDRAVNKFFERTTESCSRNRKRLRRRRLLNGRVPLRVCPSCGETKLENRSWVIIKCHVRWLPSKVVAVGAVCLSCWRTLKKGKRDG